MDPSSDSSPIEILYVSERDKPALAASSPGLELQVTPYAEAVRNTVEEQIDILMVDADLPSDAILRLRQHAGESPIVVLGGDNADTVIPAIRAGASDWIPTAELDAADTVERLRVAIARGRRSTTESTHHNPRDLRRLDVMQAMFRIVSDRSADLEDQVESVLREGCRLFDQDVGIVSRVEGESYWVEHVYSPTLPIVRGQRFELGNTFCCVTLASARAMGTHDVERSPWTDHPCLSTGLKSYIGVPLIVGGRPYGTLNFSSPARKATPYLDIDMELVATLGGWLGTMLTRDSYLAELEGMARLDMLTGLSNRKGFLDRLDSACRRRELSPAYSFAVLFIDLDRFKQVNDRHGHLIGDHVLRETALRLQSLVRPRDGLARFAGDEFVVLLEDVTAQQAHDLATRMTKALADAIVVDGVEIGVGASIGMAASQDHHTPEALLNAADTDMYRVKRLHHATPAAAEGEPAA